MIKILHTFLLISCLLLLGSCIGGSDSDSGAGLSSFKGDGFTLGIPSNWNILDTSSGVLPTPSSGAIALSVSSPTVNNGFSNNLLILTEETDIWTSSEEFSKVTHTSSKEDYYFYSLKSEKAISFDDEGSSSLYIFEAKYNRNTPNLQFLQTGRICGNKTYLMTIAVGTAGDTGKYENILKTFECK